MAPRLLPRAVAVGALLACGVARADVAPADVTLSGYVQADCVVHRQSSVDEIAPGGEPLNHDTFSIPRSRLRAASGRGWLRGALELDAATGRASTVRVAEASVSARWTPPGTEGVALVTASMGLIRIPFGFELAERSTKRLFLERSHASRALFPGVYDLGASVSGGHAFLRYAVAVMNGEPASRSGEIPEDPSAAKDVLARVGVDTEAGRRVRVRAGVSAVIGAGLHRGTPASKDVLVWRDGNEDGLVQLTEIQAVPGAPATPSQAFERFGVGADLGVIARLPVVGELSLFGEIVRAANLDRGGTPADPVASGRLLRERGYAVGLTQELTRHAMIGVRYDRYDPDADADEQRGLRRVPRSRARSTLAFAAALRRPPGRLVLEYDRNQNALGREASGAPTSMADDALTLRAEIVF
ncbi:MAG: hypothetical protein IT374_01950 [Polyangiaceae bacterium]|nr:hypothetical protein [Polyangiaceae bacterium]